MNHPCARRAFTLVETLMTMAVLSLLMLAVLPFFIFNLRILFHGEQKLLINGDIRAITSEMITRARQANNFVLYQSFHNRVTPAGVSVSRNSFVEFGPNAGNINSLDRRLTGQAGDFVVFVTVSNNATFDARFYNTNPDDDPLLSIQVTRLVGYWIAPNRNDPTGAETALYRFDTDNFRGAAATSWTTPWGATFPATLGAAVSLESLLPPATATAATNPAFATPLVSDIEGRATDGLNFTNLGNRSVVVETRMLHGNAVKRVTNTYNFTVTPRG